MVGTAKLNGVDSEAYLRYVITHIRERRVNKVAELLPSNVAVILLRPVRDAVERLQIAA